MCIWYGRTRFANTNRMCAFHPKAEKQFLGRLMMPSPRDGARDAANELEL